MNKKIITACAILVMLVSGCTGISKEEALKKTLEAAQNVSSYKADIDVEITLDVKTAQSSQSSTSLIQGRTDVDVKNKKSYAELATTVAGQTVATASYLIDGTVYTKLSGQWTQRTSTNTWDKQHHYGAIANLIKNSDVEVVGEENVDGKPNYILKIKPDVKQLFENLLSTLDRSNLPSDLEDIVKEFAIKIWVQKDSFLLSKSDTSIVIKKDDPNTGISVNMNLDVKSKVYDHNVPVSIELPEEAILASS